MLRAKAALSFRAHQSRSKGREQRTSRNACAFRISEIAPGFGQQPHFR
jgi:hypothetical protein